MKPGWTTRLLGKKGGKIEVYHGGRVILNTIEIKDLFERRGNNILVDKHGYRYYKT